MQHLVQSRKNLNHLNLKKEYLTLSPSFQVSMGNLQTRSTLITQVLPAAATSTTMRPARHLPITSALIRSLTRYKMSQIFFFKIYCIFSRADLLWEIFCQYNACVFVKSRSAVFSWPYADKQWQHMEDGKILEMFSIVCIILHREIQTSRISPTR